ncbi:pilus assembly protein [Yoonia sp. F2084L]|uniref:TadE/TadG family type IV pilus assembly protein n=1 Tax=Yoonia sp. F2084L TaxID=2926419 RepID=UPI001FF3D218|nr:TadE/TadG family type IV pilus assembly protein [Yoonia sp. F2084L]MCK0097646.1 pilus assembly protein [Yoonia sp. F2084L]
MMRAVSSINAFWRQFVKDEAGTTSLEFVIVFPVFFGMFLMTYESGMISTRHVMLERGVETAVRDVRIGSMPNPTRESLRERICEVAGGIPDCLRQLEIELLQRDPTNWTAVPEGVRCVNRGDLDRDPGTIDPTGNNQLMFLLACVRIDPFITSPIYGLIGRAVVDGNSSTNAGGSYALVSRGAFVVEPFRANEEEEEDGV